MKSIRKFLFAAVALIAGMTACQKESEYGEPCGIGASVKMTVCSPEALVTKALGDGTKVTELYYTAFVDGKPVHSLQNKVALVNGKAELDLRLVRYVKYKFVFWAQAVPQEGATSPYDVSEFFNDATVTVNYQGLANDDRRDAFCASKEVLVRGKDDVDVTLRRPFAQVNLCTSDYDMLKYLGLHEGMKSETHVYGLPNVLDVLNGSVSVSDESSVPVNALFSAASIPSGEDEYITVLGQQYGYIGMNYVLASEVGETVSVGAAMQNGESRWALDVIPNVPVARNHKTHIIGDLFSEHAIIQIVVVPDFETSDNIVNM